MSVVTAHDVGQNEPSVKAFQDYIKKYIINYTDLDATAFTYLIPVPANRTIWNIRARVLTAFAGGTPTIKVGDAADDDGFLVTTDLTVTAAGNVVQSFKKETEDGGGVATPNAFAQGKHYASAGVVKLTGTTGLTAGQLLLELVFDGYDSDAPKDMIQNY